MILNIYSQTPLFLPETKNKRTFFQDNIPELKPYRYFLLLNVSDSIHSGFPLTLYFSCNTKSFGLHRCFFYVSPRAASSVVHSQLKRAELHTWAQWSPESLPEQQEITRMTQSCWVGEISLLGVLLSPPVMPDHSGAEWSRLCLIKLRLLGRHLDSHGGIYSGESGLSLQTGIPFDVPVHTCYCPGTFVCCQNIQTLKILQTSPHSFRVTESTKHRRTPF